MMQSADYYYQNYLKHIPKQVIVNNRYATNQELQNVIVKNFLNAVNEVKPFAQDFKGNTVLRTCENIFNFLSANINYKSDGKYLQNNRLPSNFLKTKSGDCKSYALFTAAILYVIYGQSVTILLKLVCFDNYKVPSHIYVEVVDNHSNAITIDATIPYFNKESKFISFKYINPINGKQTPMKVITSINGNPINHNPINYDDYQPFIYNIPVSQNETTNVDYKIIEKNGEAYSLPINGELFNKLKAKAQKLVESAKETAAEALKNGKTIVLAPARGAFLALVALNVHNLASIIYNSVQQGSRNYIQNTAKYKDLWLKFGGNWEQFVKVVNEGRQKKPLFGVEGTPINEPITVASAIAAATPIIIAIVKLIKEIKNDKDSDNLENSFTDSLNNLPESVYNGNNQDEPNPNNPDNRDQPNESNNSNKPDKKESNNGMILLGTAALAALLLSKNN